MGKENNGMSEWRWDNVVYILDSGKYQYARYMFGKEGGREEERE